MRVADPNAHLELEAVVAEGDEQTAALGLGEHALGPARRLDADVDRPMHVGVVARRCTGILSRVWLFVCVQFSTRSEINVSFGIRCSTPSRVTTDT